MNSVFWDERVFFGSGYTLGLLHAVYLHGRAGDLAARVRGEASLIASDVLDYLGEAFTSITEKSYPSGVSNSRYVIQVTRRRRWTPSHLALVDIAKDFQGEWAYLARKFFGAEAVKNFEDLHG